MFTVFIATLALQFALYALWCSYTRAAKRVQQRYHTQRRNAQLGRFIGARNRLGED